MTRRVFFGGQDFADLGTHLSPVPPQRTLRATATGTVELSPYWATVIVPASRGRDIVEIRAAGPTGIWIGNSADVRPATGQWVPAGESIEVATSEEVWGCAAELIPNGGFEDLGGPASGGPNGWPAGWYGSQFDPALIPSGIAPVPSGVLLGAARTSIYTNPNFFVAARREFAATRPEIASRFIAISAVYQSSIGPPPPAQGVRLVSSPFPIPDGASYLDVVGWWYGSDGRSLGVSCSLGLALSDSPTSAVSSTSTVLQLAASPGTVLGTRLLRLESTPWALGVWSLVRTRIPVVIGYATGASARWGRLHLYQDRWISDNPPATDLDQYTCWDAVHVPAVVTWRELSFSNRG